MLSKSPVCSLPMMQNCIELFRQRKMHHHLQEDIDSLARRSLNWQLRIGNDKNPQTYYMNEQPLDYVIEEKVLSWIID